MQTTISPFLEKAGTSSVELPPVRAVEGLSEDVFPRFGIGFQFKHQWTETSSVSGEPERVVRSEFPVETSILLEITSLLSWLSANHIRLSESELIEDYLLQFPDLLDVIPLAVRAARKHLPEAQLTLSLYRDPEAEDRYLTLYVRLKSYDESVIERIETAEAEFLDRLANKEGWLQLTTDFREPEAEDAL